MKILKIKAVKELTGLSRTTIYRLITAKQFPRQIPLGEHSCGWLESEVLDWIQARVALRNQVQNAA